MITLNTIIYEGNYRNFLNDNTWFFKFKSNLITKKTITINNLTSFDDFQKKLNNIKTDINIDLIHVNECKEQINSKYKLQITENTLGYYYTIPYFCCIENIKTPYLFNVATDCMRDIKVDDSFFLSSIEKFNIDPDCSTTMVSWDDNFNPADQEEHDTTNIFKKIKKSDNFYYRANFTDQLFFGDINKLKNIDYNIEEKYGNIIYHGPYYGGNSFEKRMVSHHVKNLKYNCVYKNNNYYKHDKV